MQPNHDFFREVPLIGLLGVDAVALVFAVLDLTAFTLSGAADLGGVVLLELADASGLSFDCSAPWKIRSHPEENLSLLPVCTV